MTEIHKQLLRDCHYLGRLRLCHLLLMNDRQFPWFILVPDRDEVTEIYQLPEADQQRLLQESSLLAQVLQGLYQGDKMNIAALGNVVNQLHVHHIVRYRGDPAWPAPVWGKVEAIPYTRSEVQNVAHRLQAALVRELEPDPAWQ